MNTLGDIFSGICSFIKTLSRVDVWQRRLPSFSHSHGYFNRGWFFENTGLPSTRRVHPLNLFLTLTRRPFEVKRGKLKGDNTVQRKKDDQQLKRFENFCSSLVSARILKVKWSCHSVKGYQLAHVKPVQQSHRLSVVCFLARFFFSGRAKNKKIKTRISQLRFNNDHHNQTNVNKKKGARKSGRLCMHIKFLRLVWQLY